MAQISVITPSVRPEGLKLVEKALRRQTFKDFEWIIVSSFLPVTLLEVRWLEEPEKKKDDLWVLNKAYNTAIQEARSDLIVSWQDYTYAKPDTLEKFWFHYQQDPKKLITAVGNKYSDETFTVQTWKDPRERDDQGTFYPCYWNDIEWNLCSVPKQAVLDVGGFDEEMDKYYGLDGFNVLNRIQDVGGYDFWLDQTIKSYSLEHGRLAGEKWDELNWMKDNRYNTHVARRKQEGKWPVLSYLQRQSQPL